MLECINKIFFAASVSQWHRMRPFQMHLHLFFPKFEPAFSICSPGSGRKGTSALSKKFALKMLDELKR